jgi:hypothetical protein
MTASNSKANEFQKVLYALPGKDRAATDMAGTCRELTPPVAFTICYDVHGELIENDIVVRYLRPNCLEDVKGFQKPFWCVRSWEAVHV